MTDANEIARGLTKAQRRAYIDTSRRLQPIAELERKACKASGRHGGMAEKIDLSIAYSALRDREYRDRYFTTCWLNFCSLCGEFGRGRWDEARKRYPGPIAHKARCADGPDRLTPHPGWSAVVSTIPCPPGPQAPGWERRSGRRALEQGEVG